MRVKEYVKPRPHIVIDDVFSDTVVDSMLDEACSLRLHPGTMWNDKKQKKIKNRKTKNVDDLDLDEEYDNNKRKDSAILTAFDNLLWSEEMQKIYRESRYPIFNTLIRSTKDFIHLIGYKNGEYYDWHEDNYSPPVGLTTMSFMVGNKHNAFKGGEFEIMFGDEAKIIPFKRNRLVIFSRNTLHRALPTRVDSDDPRDFRYTIQIWAE